MTATDIFVALAAGAIGGGLMVWWIRSWEQPSRLKMKQGGYKAHVPPRPLPQPPGVCTCTERTPSGYTLHTRACLAANKAVSYQSADLGEGD
jgi:hypothetical protein